jgi:hypothetical protein
MMTNFLSKDHILKKFMLKTFLIEELRNFIKVNIDRSFDALHFGVFFFVQV